MAANILVQLSVKLGARPILIIVEPNHLHQNVLNSKNRDWLKRPFYQDKAEGWHDEKACIGEALGGAPRAESKPHDPGKGILKDPGSLVRSAYANLHRYERRSDNRAKF
jgi:hypothetical protein